MSALQTFERMREYRQRAADYYRMASRNYSDDVRARYLAIADHFLALADADMQADRLERKRRLQEMQSNREAMREEHREGARSLRFGAQQ
ncbi:MAG: hypothetical protein WBE48_18360 [Xanthobacteraceae bacterium]|jgi:hypothetical protein